MTHQTIPQIPPMKERPQASPFQAGQLYAIYQLRGEVPSASFSRVIRDSQMSDADSFLLGYGCEMADYLDTGN